jgi:cell division protein FtsX
MKRLQQTLQPFLWIGGHCVAIAIYFAARRPYASRMNKLRQLIASDIPFARDDANRLLPAMIACLTGFAALLLAVAMCLSNGLAERSHAVIGVLQVELPRAKAADSAYLQSVTELLNRTAGVQSVTPLDQTQMEGLLKPWLGDDFSLTDLPVPMILDVQTAVTHDTTSVDIPALRSALSKLDTNIRVEDRGPWVGHMVQAVSLLQGLVLLIAILLILCVLGMIVLVARTNLRLHFKTVSLLHMFGATDEYILRQFQWNNAWLTARGALGGVLFAGLVFTAAVVISARWDSPMMPHINISLLHGVMFVVLPLFTDDQDARYDAKIYVTFRLFTGERALSDANADIAITRSRSINEQASVAQRESIYHQMTREMMVDFDRPIFQIFAIE